MSENRKVVPAFQGHPRMGPYGPVRLAQAADGTEFVDVERLDAPPLRPPLSPERLEALRTAMGRYAVFRHPGLLHLRDLGQEDDKPTFTWGHVEGRLLSERLGEGPLPVHEVLPLLAGILEALAALHDVGLPHGDLVPECILLGEEGRVWISDAGIAPALEATEGAHDALSQVHFAYRAPERFQGEGLLSSDLYALGLIGLEMLLGRKACPARAAAEAARWHASDARGLPEVLPTCPPWLTRILLCLCSRQAEDRPWNADNALEILEAAIRRAAKTVAEAAPTPGASPPSHAGVLATAPAPASDEDFDEQATDPGIDMHLAKFSPPREAAPPPEPLAPDPPASTPASPTPVPPDPEPPARVSRPRRPLGVAAALALLASLLVLVLLGLAFLHFGSRGVERAPSASLVGVEATPSPLARAEPAPLPAEEPPPLPPPTPETVTPPAEALAAASPPPPAGEPAATTRPTATQPTAGRDAREGRGARRARTGESSASGAGTRAPGLGALSFDTSPSGAEVFLDGRRVGRTPIEALSMSEGNHVLTIRKEGFLSKDLSVSVAAGRKSYWAPVPLAPAP